MVFYTNFTDPRLMFKLFEKITMKIFTIIYYLLLFVESMFLTTKSIPAQVSTNLDYFKGIWAIKLKNKPKLNFIWTVKEDFNKSWLTGVVEQNGKKTSTDFWRQNGNKIERFAFTGNSVTILIESKGWEGNKMLVTGVMSDKNGETKVRETITKITNRKFNALWEMKNAEGEWTVFSDEFCKKLN